MLLRSGALLLSVLMSFMPAVPALAQSTGLQPFPLGGNVAPEPATSTQNVKISVTYQFFVEGDATTMSEQSSLADRGRKHLYLMLAKECVVLKETIAETCAIERASVNAQLNQQSRSRSNGLRISGSASYRIALKPEPEPSKQ